MLLVLAGLVWGLVVPSTPYPRLALGAHIQFMGNGMLVMLIGMALLALPHEVGPKSVRVMLTAVWLTWVMVLSEVGNAWWGTAGTLPIAAGQAGASGGQPWQEIVVMLTHVGAGLGLIVSWVLLLRGFLVRADNR
jgi:hydroxylaminobenzene mutase